MEFIFGSWRVAIRITHKLLTEMIANTKKSFSKKKNIECVYYGRVQYKDHVDSFGVLDPDFKSKKTPFSNGLEFFS